MNDVAEPVLVAVLTVREWSIVLAHLQCGRYSDVVDVIDLLTCQLSPQADAARDAAVQMSAIAKAGLTFRMKPAVDTHIVDAPRIH